MAVKILVNSEQGESNFKLKLENADMIDLSLALSQLELLKMKILNEITKQSQFSTEP
jgi:hypothetical protein